MDGELGNKPLGIFVFCRCKVVRPCILEVAVKVQVGIKSCVALFFVGRKEGKKRREH